MTADKISVSISPELHSALVLAALERHSTISRQLELYLRENPDLQRFIRVVRAEPDVGIQLVSRRFLKEMRGRKARAATPPA